MRHINLEVQGHQITPQINVCLLSYVIYNPRGVCLVTGKQGENQCTVVEKIKYLLIYSI